MRKLGKVVALREPDTFTITFDDEEFGLLLLVLHQKFTDGFPARQRRMGRRFGRLFERLVKHPADNDTSEVESWRE